MKRCVLNAEDTLNALLPYDLKKGNIVAITLGGRAVKDRKIDQADFD